MKNQMSLFDMHRKHAPTGEFETYHADCLEVLPNLGGAKAVITDPPYMINTKSDGLGKLSPWSDLMNSAYWYAAWMGACRETLQPDGVLLTFLNWRSLPTFMKALADIRWSADSLIVWNKIHMGPAGPKQFRTSYELVLLCGNHDFQVKNRSIKDVQDCAWPAAKLTDHPAEKPIALMELFIRELTGPGDLVIDPFMGSGTTGAAAIQNGRKFIGIEQDKRWHDYAHDRLQKIKNTMGNQS